jgi:hypothetical protein
LKKKTWKQKKDTQAIGYQQITKKPYIKQTPVDYQQITKPFSRFLTPFVNEIHPMTPAEKQTYTTAQCNHTTVGTTNTHRNQPHTLPKKYENTVQTINQKSNKFSEKIFSENVNFCTHLTSRTPMNTSFQKLNTQKNALF